MTLSPETVERLSSLLRVVGKEITHFEYADQQAFSPLLTREAVEGLDNNPAPALRIEAFTSRFCRLQDTLGDKLLPALLKALREPVSALLINLNKAEKYGWLDSADQWVNLRRLRNKMIREYIEDSGVLYATFHAACGSPAFGGRPRRYQTLKASRCCALQCHGDLTPKASLGRLPR